MGNNKNANETKLFRWQVKSNGY